MIDTEVHSDSTHTDLQGLTVDGPKGRSWVRFFSALKSTNVMYLRLMQLTNNVGTYLLASVIHFEVKIKWFVMRQMAMNRD